HAGRPGANPGRPGVARFADGVPGAGRGAGRGGAGGRRGLSVGPAVPPLAEDGPTETGMLYKPADKVFLPPPLRGRERKQTPSRPVRRRPPPPPPPAAPRPAT